MRSLVVFLLFSVQVWAQTGASQMACAQAYLTPWQLALHKHAMYSKVDNPMVIRAVTHFMKKLDPFGTFFLESDHHTFLKPSTHDLNAARIQVEKQEYQHFQKILTRYTQSVARAKDFLTRTPRLRELIMSRVESEGFQARRDNFDFSKPPKTVEEQNEKFLDYMTSIYADLIRQKYDPAEAYALTVRSMRRAFQEIEADASLPIYQLALKSMMAGLDPHTSFMNKLEFEAYKESTRDNFVGVGVNPREMILGFAIEVAPSGPAAKAGLRDGDIITHVVDSRGVEIPTRGKSPSDVYNILDGPENTQVTVRVKRGTETNKLTITRETIKRTGDLLQAGVAEGPGGEKLGQITLESFYHNADNHIAGILKRMVNEAKIDGLLIDLRGNGGGDLHTALNIMSLFVDGGPGILMNRFRNDVGRTIETLEVPKGMVMFNGPVVILVNELSASASELVSLSLRDRNRVVIVGAPRTFGKGTQQGIHDMIGPDGKPTGEGIKVTESVFLGPRGTSPNLTGVRSDIRLRENELPHGVLVSYPDTTMPNITVASRIPISKTADHKHHDLIAKLTRLHAERSGKEPADPSMTAYEKEQNDALHILIDYIHAVRLPN